MQIHRETVSDILWAVLNRLMNLDILSNFRLVGGTSLSFLLGHRVSIDIDMFTDSAYGSVDFMEMYRILEREFGFIDGHNWINTSMGNERNPTIIKSLYAYKNCKQLYQSGGY